MIQHNYSLIGDRF